MKIKLYYYNPYITLNDVKTAIPFSALLDRVRGNGEEDRFKETPLGEYSLLRMRHPNENREITNRSVCFADYRVRKPNVGERGSDRYDDIADDVFESTNCFYEYNNKLFIMEYNHYGAKAKQIESYLSTFLKSDEHNEWRVKLEPIEPDISLRDVLSTTDIRNLEIKLDLDHASSDFLTIYPDDEEPPSIFQNIANLFRDTKDVHEQVGGNVAVLYFGNGISSGGNKIDTAGIQDIIRVLELDSDFFISIKVSYHSPSEGKVITHDFKNSAIMKEEIEVSGDAWETITEGIENYFYDFGRKGQGLFQRFQTEIIQAELPPIE